MASIRKIRPLPVFGARMGRGGAEADSEITGFSDDMAEDLVRGDNSQF